MSDFEIRLIHKEKVTGPFSECTTGNDAARVELYFSFPSSQQPSEGSGATVRALSGETAPRNVQR